MTGYRIYYQTEGDQGNVDVGPSATQHVLTGLCGGRNYSIYLVALSAHLPSPVVGPVVVKLGELQAFNKTLLRNSLHFNKCIMCWTKFSLPVLYSFTYLD